MLNSQVHGQMPENVCTFEQTLTCEWNACLQTHQQPSWTDHANHLPPSARQADSPGWWCSQSPPCRTSTNTVTSFLAPTPSPSASRRPPMPLPMQSTTPLTPHPTQERRQPILPGSELLPKTTASNTHCRSPPSLERQDTPCCHHASICSSANHDFFCPLGFESLDPQGRPRVGMPCGI